MKGIGNLVGIALLTMSLLPKAALEIWYFHDRESAIFTLFCWGFGTLLLLSAFALSLFFAFASN